MANYIPEDSGNFKRAIVLLIVNLSNALVDKLPYQVEHKGRFLNLRANEDGWWASIAPQGIGGPATAVRGATFQDAIASARRSIDDEERG